MIISIYIFAYSPASMNALVRPTSVVLQSQINGGSIATDTSTTVMNHGGRVVTGAASTTSQRGGVVLAVCVTCVSGVTGVPCQ